MIRTVIVEDDLMVAAINKKYAERTEEISVTAIFHNGQEAWKYLQNSDTDLIILDVFMPGMTGLQLLQNIRQSGLHTDVIMITAANDGVSIAAALELGIVDYLVKPFEYERFSQAIQRYVLRNNIIKNHMAFEQRDIDELLQMHQRHKEEQTGTGSCKLAKGLQLKTLEIIRLAMNQRKREAVTSEDLAAETGLSKVTIRRYMNYLIEENEIVSDVDYGTGGRPSIQYRLR